MRSINTSLRLVLAALIALAMVADAQATIYFVNPSGNDNNTGMSVPNSFRTIKKAAEVIQNGDTVFVAAGTYTDEIVVNGIQGLSLPAVFIGNSGATVNAPWKVVNSNHVQIKGFTFQDGGADRLLVWKGSYEGLIQDCTFDAGRQSLLVNSGSLTIEDSQITSFEQEGIQVDGESRLVVRDSTISGCQASGLEIRKIANVLVDNCEVKDNLGNGVEVNMTTDSIDTGPDGRARWQGSVPLAGADGPVSIGGNGQIYGDLYRPAEYPVDPSDVSGTIYDLPPTMSFPPIDPVDAATNNDNAGIPKTDKNNDPLNVADEFSLNSNDGVDLPPGTYYFTNLDCKPNSDIRISGPTIVYVAGNVVLKGDVNMSGAPNNLHIYVLGAFVDITSQADVNAAIYAPDATIKMRGGSEVEGMVLAGSIDMAGGSEITTHPSLEALAASLLPAPPSSPSTPSSWQPVSSGELDISGSKLSGNANAVRMVTPQAFTATSSDFSGNGWGLRLRGSFDLVHCTASDNTTGGVWLTDITDADVQVVNLTLNDNTQYGLYAESCNLTFNSTKIADWAISGSEIAIAGVGSDLSFDAVTISGGTTAGVQLSQGTMNATSTTFSGSGTGLSVDDANITLTSCTLTGNTVGLSANWNATVAVTGTSISNNSSYGINSNYSTLTLSGLTVSGSSTAAVHAVGGSLSVSSSTLSASGYGIWAETADAAVIDTCTLSGNTTGLYANQNTSLQVTNSTFTGSALWGASVTPKTAGGLSAIFDACTFHSNAGGLSLVNAIDGQVSLRSGTLIRDNTNSGLHFENGNLTVNDQAGGTAWRTLRNGYGISSTGSTLTLANISVEESSLYGVRCENSSVNLANSTVTGVGGVYADAANDSLTVDSTRFDASSAGGWGVVRYGGNLDVKNCVLNGFDGGVFLFTVSSVDQAAVNNSTLVNLAGYGVYLILGDATVQNTVIVGGSNAYGLKRVFGQLTHSHNLLDGFGTPFSGTTADASELLKKPRFVDAANGDFRLAKGSPAINSGADLTAGGVMIDILGNTRPSHKVFEIGAYEYMQDDGSLRVLSWKEER